MFNWLKKRRKKQRDRIYLNLVDVYTDSPGCRYESEMPFSGERFRKEFLHPQLNNAIWHDEVLVVNLDGAYGYATAFIDEAFGGLIRVEGEILAEIEPHLEIVSKEEPFLIEEIRRCMEKSSNV